MGKSLPETWRSIKLLLLHLVGVPYLLYLSITYFECVSVTAVISHAKRMRRIILSSVTCLALPNFSTLPHKWYDFREIKCVLGFCLLMLTQTFLVLIRTERDITTNVHMSSYNFPLFLLNFNHNCIFLIYFRKKNSSNIKLHKNP
jgi:hypothetical protein